MANFAERIAYWYLRLNGFLLLENFVHHSGPDRSHAADADLLGVRFPYASELLDGNVVVLDDWTRFDVNPREPVVVIVQVKGGDGDAARAFSRDRLLDGLRRIGIWSEEEAGSLADALAGLPSAARGPWRVLKLVIGPNAASNAEHVSLIDAHRFVRARIRHHLDWKRRDWVHFHDPLIQLIAWEEEQASLG